MANPPIDNLAIIRAMRARLQALLVLTTGSIDLSVTTAGYARVTGSFVTDKFEKGMEVAAVGFGNAANNGVSVVTKVEPLLLTTRMLVITRAAGVRTVSHPAHVAEGSASGRTLSVGLPTLVAWNNAADDGPVFQTEPGYPYIDEQYLRGPARMASLSPTGRLEGLPLWRPRINVPAGVGEEAATRYADAMLALYPPGDVIALPNNVAVHINAAAAPYADQLLPGKEGFAGLLCTIPMEVHAYNSL
jgi:hypothetical protein